MRRAASAAGSPSKFAAPLVSASEGDRSQEGGHADETTDLGGYGTVCGAPPSRREGGRTSLVPGALLGLARHTRGRRGSGRQGAGIMEGQPEGRTEDRPEAAGNPADAQGRRPLC